jgi:hypothetical protein
VAQDEALIEVRSRDDAGQWTVRSHRQGERAVLDAAGASLDVDSVYREARKNARA